MIRISYSLLNKYVRPVYLCVRACLRACVCVCPSVWMITSDQNSCWLYSSLTCWFDRSDTNTIQRSKVKVGGKSSKSPMEEIHRKENSFSYAFHLLGWASEIAGQVQHDRGAPCLKPWCNDTQRAPVTTASSLMSLCCSYRHIRTASTADRLIRHAEDDYFHLYAKIRCYRTAFALHHSSNHLVSY